MKPFSLALQAYPDALLDMDQHPVAIDFADLEVAELGRPEHGTIGNAERGAILEPWPGWCRASSPKAAQQLTRALLGPDCQNGPIASGVGELFHRQRRPSA